MFHKPDRRDVAFYFLVGALILFLVFFDDIVKFYDDSIYPLFSNGEEEESETSDVEESSDA